MLILLDVIEQTSKLYRPGQEWLERSSLIYVYNFCYLVCYSHQIRVKRVILCNIDVYNKHIVKQTLQIWSGSAFVCNPVCQLIVAQVDYSHQLIVK